MIFDAVRCALEGCAVDWQLPLGQTHNVGGDVHVCGCVDEVGVSEPGRCMCVATV
jgi:hypothetical protein